MPGIVANQSDPELVVSPLYVVFEKSGVGKNPFPSRNELDPLTIY